MNFEDMVEERITEHRTNPYGKKKHTHKRHNSSFLDVMSPIAYKKDLISQFQLVN
jgi:hypothetical protein